MNQITDPPIEYDAGLAFDYAGWTPGSRVTLTNVPWDSGYRDVAHFEGRAQLDAYLNTRPTTETVTRVSYMRTNMPIKLEIPYSKARHFNYMRVSNAPQHGISGDVETVYYYFIKHVAHSAPDTTEFVIQLDVWQSFIYDCTVTRGYLERGHLAMVLGQPDGAGDWLAEPEPFDLGADYVPRQWGMYQHNLFLDYDFIISSTNSLTRLPGQNSDPVRESSTGSNMGNIPLPVESYMIRGADLVRYFADMAIFSWVTSGIYRVVAVPKFPGGATTAVPRKKHEYDGIKFKNYPPGPEGSADSYLRTINNAMPDVTVKPWTGLREALEKTFNEINPAYGWMKKFHTAPFSQLFMTDNVGRSLTLDPRIAENEVRFRGVQSLVPGAEETRVIVTNYGRHSVTAGDIVLCINGYPVLPTLNDNASIALASQARGLSQAREGAMWAQSRALAANANSFDNTTLGINAAGESSRLSRNLDASQTNLSQQTAQSMLAPRQINAVVGGLIGGSTGGKTGAAVGALTGAASAMTMQWEQNIQAQAGQQQLGLRMEHSRAQSALSDATARGIRDNNSDLAVWGAKGDYAQAIAAMDAKVQDAQLIQPSMNGQVGGEMAAWVMRLFNLNGYIKTIREAAVIRIGQYWARYGYSSNRFVNVARLSLMTRYTYWKLLDAGITPAPGMGEDYLNALRGIFEKGVTVFDKPEYIQGPSTLGQNRIKE